MRNPLSKRFPREIRHNLGKYLGLFAMMVFAVSFTSGFLLAASSIEKICLEMDGKYHVEDGHFTCDFEPDEEALDAVRACGVTVHEDFCKTVQISFEDAEGRRTRADARLYTGRSEVNIPAYAQGAAPARAGQIALDRVFMENNGLHVGDSVSVGGKQFELTGCMTLPDYQALFENNNDFIFNAQTFTVGLVAQKSYDKLSASAETYNYAFFFEEATLDAAARNDIEEDMVDALVDNDATPSDFVDAEDNQGIGYALDDVQGDQVMWIVLLLLLVVIMAFIFVVLTGSTIEAESSVIGTLLASGWRKGELLRHYLFLPALIGLVAVAAGLVLGVTIMSDPMKGLYYNSYSLPPYEMTWNWFVVFITAVVPYLLLVGITFAGLARKLKFTPLQFLRHEVATRKRRGNMSLPSRLPYATRFRARVLLRNAGNFVTLFFGIMFASLLLLFGICMLPVVENYANELKASVAALHQYVLKVPVELDGSDEDKEAYAAVLRLLEDHERIDANQDAVDAAERLQDNEELLDALERLQDNEELLDALERLEDDEALMDAVERLQDNRALMDAAQRLQGNQALMDAAERLQNNQELVNAAKRLQSKQSLVAAAQRLSRKPRIMKAAQRLQSQQSVVAAFERLSKKPKLMAAAQRLASQQDMVAAFERLADKQDVVAAAQRLSGKKKLVAAAERLQSKKKLMAAVERIEAGKATQEDLALVASVDAATKKDLDTVSKMSKREKADLEILSSASKQTKADLETVASANARTRKDIALVQKADSRTRKDLQTIASMSAQTKADLKTLSHASARTKRDIELVSKMSAQTKRDMDLVSKMSAQTKRDIELVQNADRQTRDDLELIADADEQTRDDLQLVAKAEGQTRDDLELIANADEQTRDDLQLIADASDEVRDDLEALRGMDQDLLDDLRLAADVDEDAHVVNTQDNAKKAIAGAEKFAMASVEIERAWGGEFENVSVYGIQPDSAYWTDVPVADGAAVASAGLLEKTKAQIGQETVLENRRAGETYSVVAAGQTSNEADVSLYMTLDDFNDMFGNDTDYFNAYASAEELSIDERYVAHSIVPEDMDKISSQMADSMGSISGMMLAMAIPVYLIIVFLLTKTVIGRSARSISYMKVFGYRNREVDGLYIRPVTYAVAVSLVLSIPIIVALLTLLLKAVFMAYAGNFPLIIPASNEAMVVAIGLVAYALVAFLHVRNIKRVPLSLALKVQE